MEITKTNNSITIDFAADDLNIIGYYVLDPVGWVEDAVRNKLANRKAHLIDEWTRKFQQEKTVASIPTDEAVLLSMIFAHPQFDLRFDRDKE